jgi:uncharacterized membrane protein YqgA involved in biofilm formation
VSEVERQAERLLRRAMALCLGLFAAGIGIGMSVMEPFVLLGLCAVSIVGFAVLFSGIQRLADMVERLAADLDAEKRARAQDAGGWLRGQHIEDRRS